MLKTNFTSTDNPYYRFVSPGLYQDIKKQTNLPKESMPIDDLQSPNKPCSPPKIHDIEPTISNKSVLNDPDSNSLQINSYINGPIQNSLPRSLVNDILVDSIINIDKIYKQLILPAKPSTPRALKTDTDDLKPLIQFCHDHNKSTFLGLKTLKDTYPNSSIVCIDDSRSINKLIQNQLGCTTLNPKEPNQLRLDLVVSIIPKETTIILLDVDFDFTPNMKVNPDEIGSIIQQKEMIDYNGLDIAKKVKALKEFEHIEIFLISAASSLNELKERILNVHVDGYVFFDKNIDSCKSYVKDLIPNDKTDMSLTQSMHFQRDTYEETDTSSIPSITSTPIQEIKKESNNEINSNEVLESISNFISTKITRIPIRPETPKGSYTVNFPSRYLHNNQ